MTTNFETLCKKHKGDKYLDRMVLARRHLYLAGETELCTDVTERIWTHLNALEGD